MDVIVHDVTCENIPPEQNTTKLGVHTHTTEHDVYQQAIITQETLAGCQAASICPPRMLS
jgi:hypothetical protein